MYDEKGWTRLENTGTVKLSELALFLSTDKPAMIRISKSDDSPIPEVKTRQDKVRLDTRIYHKIQLLPCDRTRATKKGLLYALQTAYEEIGKRGLSSVILVRIDEKPPYYSTYLKHERKDSGSHGVEDS